MPVEGMLLQILPFARQCRVSKWGSEQNSILLTKVGSTLGFASK